MSLNIFQWRSIKTKVTLFTLAIFMIGMWSVAFYVIQVLRVDMLSVLSEQQFSQASFMASEINEALESRMVALEVVAQRVSPANLGNAASMQIFLEKHPVLQSLFNGSVMVHRLDGTVIAEVPVPAGRINVHYMDADTLIAAFKLGKPTIWVGRPNSGERQLAPVIHITAPIGNSQSNVIGALAGTINLGMPSILDKITGQLHGKTRYLLIDPLHRIIVKATDKSLIMKALPASPIIDRFNQGYQGSGIVANLHGVEMLASAKSIPVVGWYVVALLPAVDAFAPIVHMQQRILLATILLTLLVGVLTWWMLRRQLSPMLAATKTLAAMSETDHPVLVLPVHRKDETGELIDSFNRLLKSLKQQECLLKTSEYRLRTIIETSPECIKIVDAQMRILLMNPTGLQMIEADSLEQVAGHSVLDIISSEYHAAYSELHRRVLAGEPGQMEFELLGLKGGHRWLESHVVPMQDNGETVHLAITRDITKRKQVEEKLLLAASVFTHAREGIVITTSDGTIVDVNDTFRRITGFSRDEVMGKNTRILSSGRQGKAFYAAMWRDLIEKGYWHDEIWNRRKNGEVYAEMLTISAVRDIHGNTQQYVALFSDITALKEHERQLEHIAHYDALTGLPNRILLADRLRQAMTQAQRHKHRLAVAYVDLDGFKLINDRHGHEAGDQLLITVAARTKQALREGDTLARLGGDEFAAVLGDLDDIEACVPMLTRLLSAAALPVQTGDLTLQVSASIGVTFYPQEDDMDADQLLRQADQAMYQAKLAGKNRYHVFDADQDRSVRGYHEALTGIRLALSRREFVLHYQPKVNMRSGKVIGAEGLIRWQHPEKGLLPPAMFLPVIEDHPLAIELGEWVIDSALIQMELWHAAGLDIPVSVNVGARQLQQADFVARLHEILAAHPNLKPGNLELEVLETSALDDLTRVSRIIEGCREIGVNFALDDFGTGYSSLTYLKHLKVTQLKIDQSFVRDMLGDPEDLAILNGVIGLAVAFRRQVIAEGVETTEHGAMLLQLGCDLAQGYGIARPMPAHQLPGWSATWHPDPDWAGLSAVSRDDLPLLFAGVEHRAWITTLENHLMGEPEAPPPLDPHQCRFGRWLDAEGQVRYGMDPVFKTIESLHCSVHELAVDLLELQAGGRNPEALARLSELHGLRDAMLEQLKSLCGTRSSDSKNQRP